MKIKYVIIIFFIILKIQSFGQIKVNIGVDTTTNKAPTVIKFLDKYFTDFKENNSVDYQKYYYEKDVKSFTYPDKVAFGLLGNTTNYILGKPQILALDVKSDTISAKVMFADIDSNQNINHYFTANYYIKYTKGSCKFLITQNIETKDWQKTTLRNVTFHYPPLYDFNSKKAQILIDSIISLEKNWGLDPLEIGYYFANTNKEIQAIKGFDYNYYMARSDYAQGLALQKEKTIYCSGYGENCFHEVVHLYLNPLYPKTPLKEGIATFYGGSINKSYKEDLVRLHHFIENKPAINIADHSTFYYMDEQTIPKYVIQAFICQLIYNKKGVKGLKKLLEIDSLDNIYKKEFGIEPENQNAFLRKEIKKYVSDTK